MNLKSYLTSSGRDLIKDFVKDLSADTQIEIFTLFRRLENGEMLSMPHSRSLSTMSKGLYELRVRDRDGQIRIFYYTKIKDTIFFVHALRKKSQIISQKDRELILKRIAEVVK